MPLAGYAGVPLVMPSSGLSHSGHSLTSTWEGQGLVLSLSRARSLPLSLARSLSRSLAHTLTLSLSRARSLFEKGWPTWLEPAQEAKVVLREGFYAYLPGVDWKVSSQLLLCGWMHIKGSRECIHSV